MLDAPREYLRGLVQGCLLGCFVGERAGQVQCGWWRAHVAKRAHGVPTGRAHLVMGDMANYG
jgi:hypothetical protein